MNLFGGRSPEINGSSWGTRIRDSSKSMLTDTKGISIGSIEFEGILYEDPMQIKHVAVAYFQGIFKEQSWRRH